MEDRKHAETVSFEGKLDHTVTRSSKCNGEAYRQIESRVTVRSIGRYNEIAIHT